MSRITAIAGLWAVLIGILLFGAVLSVIAVVDHMWRSLWD